MANERFGVIALKETVDVVIALAGSLSDAINCGRMTPAKIFPPAGTEGSYFTFQISLDGTNYGNFYDKDGVEVSVPFTAGTPVELPISKFLRVQYLKIRTGTAASPTAQEGAAATLQLDVIAL